MWLDIKGPIVANTAYCDGKLVARDVALTLPAVTLKTSTFPGMGEIELPIPGQTEAMEAAITKIGIDEGLNALTAFESKMLEFRFVQDVKKGDGTTKVEGCKAFLRCTPKGIPELGIEPGENTEGEITLAVTRYQLFVGGDEYWLIDKLSRILRVHGKDYAKAINSLL